MIDLDFVSVLVHEFTVHADVPACFELRPIKRRGGVPPEPDVELLVEPPLSFHELFGCHVLFGLPFVIVEHEENCALVHFGQHRKVDHLVLGHD